MKGSSSRILVLPLLILLLIAVQKEVMGEQTNKKVCKVGLIPPAKQGTLGCEALNCDSLCKETYGQPTIGLCYFIVYCACYKPC
ncbi:unnamed protein product [Linum trigynum]|uniref:Uncharacterized protein n=1 Tax=Linum trigynum TaxID=586398 RepID=A0AAV2CGG8_9ROSI